MNIAILGANGFIGKNLIERFDKFDHVIYPYDKVELDLENLDLERTDYGYGEGFISKSAQPKRIELDKKMSKLDLTEINSAYGIPYSRNVDVFIQAAATTSGASDIVNKPYYHVTDNAIMNVKILQSIYNLAISSPDRKFNFVFFSCTVMYPQDLGRSVIEEDFTGEIADQYFGVGWTKVYIEKLIEFYSRLLPNVTFTVIRHSNIYGPHDKFDLEKSHVFGATLNKILTTPNGGEIEVWGDGATIRDLLYVDDLMDFVELAIEKQESNFEIYNVGSGKQLTVSKLVEKMIEISKKDLTIKYNKNKPSFKNGLWLNCAKAAKDFWWFSKTGLDEGIEKTINWLHNRIVEL